MSVSGQAIAHIDVHPRHRLQSLFMERDDPAEEPVNLIALCLDDQVQTFMRARTGALRL